MVTSRVHGVNWLDHKVADRWLEKTYKPFLDNVPEFIGKTLMGYIQDELDVLAGETVYSPELLAELLEVARAPEVGQHIGLQGIGCRTARPHRRGQR